MNSDFGSPFQKNVRLNSEALKRYDFKTKTWVQNVTDEEVPSEYWLHYNATYHLPSYPFVEDQLTFMYNEKSSKSPKGAFQV